MTGDRRAKLRAQSALNGIDFVEVANTAQTLLRVHFVNATPKLGPTAAPVTITGGAATPTVPVTSATWVTIGGREVLEVTVAAPGDFSTYTLAIASPLLDRVFASARFSFKVACPTDFDCAEPARACPPDEGPTPDIDYLAKDFESFREALFAYAAAHYPEVRERAAPDVAVVWAESLAALGDELSYYQDRVAAEATLMSATERRSIVQHARLVDYEPCPATSARASLAVVVRPGVTSLARGLAVHARRPDGERVTFEIGEGLTTGPDTFAVVPARNMLPMYRWDAREACLPRGSTELWLDGTGLALVRGDVLVIDTRAAVAGEPPAREAVVVAAPGQKIVDALEGRTVTRVVLAAPTVDAHALGPLPDGVTPRTVVYGNIVPVTQGVTRRDRFVAGSAPARIGPNGSIVRLWPLVDGPLAWLVPPGSTKDAARPWPEVEVVSARGRWHFARRLIDAEPFAHAYTVEPAAYRALGPALPGAVRHVEYDGDGGDTLRFGDGEFGAAPESDDVVLVRHRTTVGQRGNVAAGAISEIEPGSPLAALASAVHNPLPATGGKDRESADAVRRDAPEAFRQHLLRAVRPEDYRRAAEELPWVQRAGTRFRWTGSWVSAFTAVDPRDATTLVLGREREARAHLDRRRLAGRESHVVPPRFVSLDLRVTVCARADALRGHVARAVLDALAPAGAGPERRGFFHPDRLTFGTPLYRSALEAAIDRVPGVDGVTSLTFRARGQGATFVELPATLAFGPHAIVRVDADPSRPEHGSLQITVEGGR